MLAGSLAACSKETCPDGDLACLTASVQWADFTTGAGDIYGTPEALATVDVSKLLALATEGGVHLSGDASLAYTQADDHGLVNLAWTDPLGCRPSFCLSHCPRGVRCSGQARCSPLRHDGTTSATTLHWVSYAKAPAADTAHDLQIIAVSAPGCPADVTALIAAGSTTLKVSPPLRLPVTWTLGGSGGSVCAYWSCGSSSQCAAVMGAPSGTQCTFEPGQTCQQWCQTYIPGNCSCH